MGIAPYTPGGLSNSKLKLADANTGDVLNGKKFYAVNKELKTGTFVPRLKLLKSASRVGSGKISITVTGYSVYYYVFDDYDNHDQAAMQKSQGSWGLKITSRDLVIAECYGCDPNTNTTFTMTYYLGGDFGRNAWVYVIN